MMRRLEITILAALAAGCSSVVGADCAEGWALCEGQCVYVLDDPANCGGCDLRCATGEACVDGFCTADFPWDAGADDGGWSRHWADAESPYNLEDAGVPGDGAPVDGSDGGASGSDGGGSSTDGGASGSDGGGSSTDGGTSGSDGGASSTDGGGTSGSDGGASGSDGGTSVGPDGGVEACDVGERRCGAACVRIDIDPGHCGACGVACGAGFLCDLGECVPLCEMGRLACGGSCVDPLSDPNHCGGCGRRCPTGICVDGACLGPVAGHVVLIGHDYSESRPAMRRVAGNAAFLRAGRHARVLVYEGVASSRTVAGVDAAIDQVATETGRTWERATASADEVTERLANADVFAVLAQPSATDLRLMELGGMWATALRTFLARGGTVVVFDGMGANAGTHLVLAGAGMSSTASRSDVTDHILDVVSPGDALAIGVPLRYWAEVTSVRFDLGDGTVVVADESGPVVLHQIVLP